MTTEVKEETIRWELQCDFRKKYNESRRILSGVFPFTGEIYAKEDEKHPWESVQSIIICAGADKENTKRAYCRLFNGDKENKRIWEVLSENALQRSMALFKEYDDEVLKIEDELKKLNNEDKESIAIHRARKIALDIHARELNSSEPRVGTNLTEISSNIEASGKIVDEFELNGWKKIRNSVLPGEGSIIALLPRKWEIGGDLSPIYATTIDAKRDKSNRYARHFMLLGAECCDMPYAGYTFKSMAAVYNFLEATNMWKIEHRNRGLEIFKIGCESVISNKRTDGFPNSLLLRMSNELKSNGVILSADDAIFIDNQKRGKGYEYISRDGNCLYESSDELKKRCLEFLENDVICFGGLKTLGEISKGIREADGMSIDLIEKGISAGLEETVEKQLTLEFPPESGEFSIEDWIDPDPVIVKEPVESAMSVPNNQAENLAIEIDRMTKVCLEKQDHVGKTKSEIACLVKTLADDESELESSSARLGELRKMHEELSRERKKFEEIQEKTRKLLDR